MNISRRQMQALLRRSEADFPPNPEQESYEQSDPASIPYTEGYNGDRDILVPRRIRAIC